MSEVAYGKTASKRVLGIMVDFAKVLPFYLEMGASLSEVSAKLAETPCGPLFKTTVSPDATTTALFGARPRPRLRLVR